MSTLGHYLQMDFFSCWLWVVKLHVPGFFSSIFILWNAYILHNLELFFSACFAFRLYIKLTSLPFLTCFWNKFHEKSYESVVQLIHYLVNSALYRSQGEKWSTIQMNLLISKIRPLSREIVWLQQTVSILDTHTLDWFLIQ